jgi:ABC-type sugar transport system ATPase subunit
VIQLDRISIYQGSFALNDVSFTVPAGGYAAVVGKTGCGKTTLLEMTAGLRQPKSGRVLLRGVDVTGLTPAARNLGYVPQDGAVFPAMTVRENLAFTLNVRKWRRTEIDTRVSELALQLDLTPLLNRLAVGLSGGETQRVAVGRALAFRPDVLLLDEPLSAVDDDTKAKMTAVLESLKGVATVLHVTHDAAEVDRLAEIVVRL